MVPADGAESELPYHPRFRDLPTLSRDQELRLVFSWPGLADMRTVLPAAVTGSGRGRSATYPPLLLFACLVACRVYGSQRATVDRLADQGRWDDLVARYRALLGLPDEPLPARPPKDHHLDAFVQRLGADPDWLRRVSDLFTEVAIALARHLGQFPDHETVDFTSPSLSNVVFGDGTHIRPFSQVREQVDKATGEIVALGSRSRRNRPRVQYGLKEPTYEGKKVVGINHVTLSTWTEAGWVILANEQVSNQEVETAREVIGRAHDRLGTALHIVVWDGAIVGEDIRKLLHERGVLVVNKSRARGNAIHPTYAAPEIPESHAIAMALNDEPLPVGTSVYPTERGHKMIRGEFFHYGPPEGLACAHELWVDDGAFFDVVPDNGWLVKVRRATPLSTTREPQPDGTYRLRIAWHLPCPERPEGHQFTTEAGSRRRTRSGTDRSIQRAVQAARPIPRIEQGLFHTVYGLRNISESYNAWAKGRLGTNANKRRAMRLDPAAQFLDHLCTGVLANTLTAYRAVALGLAPAGQTKNKKLAA